jgi:hypothetical protein
MFGNSMDYLGRRSPTYRIDAMNPGRHQALDSSSATPHFARLIDNFDAARGATMCDTT